MAEQVVDWGTWPYFLAVARAGTLRAAADRLGVGHATVDRQVKSLESSYGVSLFTRSAGGMALTAAGSELLAEAERAEATILGARQTLGGLDRDLSGRVHLTMPSWLAYWLIAPMLARFRKKYPEIDLEISISNRFQRLTRAEADVSIRVAYDIDDPDVIARHLFVWHNAVLASEDYLDRHWSGRGRDGEGLHWLGWAGPDPHEAWAEQNLFPRATRVHSVEDELMFAQMLADGHGMAVFPVIVAKMHPQLRRVPGTLLLPDRSLWVLLHPQLRRTARVRALVDFLTEELRAWRAAFQGTD